MRSSMGQRDRVTEPAPAPKRVGVIDGFRAYAILGVVSLHLLGIAGATMPGTTSSLVIWGLLGNVIDAFFIVSGFVLFLRVVRRGGQLGSLRDYAIGRGARLMPPYWLTLGVMLLLLAIVPIAAYGFPSVQNVAVHLVAMQMPARLIDPNLAVGFGLNGALWMISVVACFYLVFPLIARWYYRHPIAGLAVAAAIALGWREAAVHLTGVFAAFSTGNPPDWLVQLIAIDQLPGWAFSFGLGMTGAWAFSRLSAADMERLRRPAVAFGLAALAGCLACAYVYGDDASAVAGPIGGSVARSSPLLVMAYTLSRGVLMAAIVVGPLWAQAPFVNRPTRRLAELSYPVYLIHLVVAIYVGIQLLDLPRDGNLSGIALWFAVVIPISLLYATVIERWVERPARAWARRASGRAPSEAATAAASPGSAQPTGSTAPRPASST
jgi:peptidoglycan/LPS O-acetylase OafA/YrhL